MAAKDNQARLKGIMSGGTSQPARSERENVSPQTEIEPVEVGAIVRGKPYSTGFDDTVVELLPVGAQLREPLQDFARRYVGARRRSGEALLEAARWLTEARSEAQHGEWQLFLEATGTTADTAERLLNIHTLAMQNPQFAESVRSNWLNQSAAALLARPSTPPEVVTEVLAEPNPPSTAEVQRRIRRPHEKGGGSEQNPQIADSAPALTGAIVEPHHGARAQETVLEMLREVARVLAYVERSAHELPASDETEQVLSQVELALASLRSSLSRS
jgi:hypothetical protein